MKKETIISIGVAVIGLAVGAGISYAASNFQQPGSSYPTTGSAVNKALDTSTTPQAIGLSVPVSGALFAVSGKTASQSLAVFDQSIFAGYVQVGTAGSAGEKLDVYGDASIKSILGVGTGLTGCASASCSGTLILNKYKGSSTRQLFSDNSGNLFAQ